ncbi:hypothetical protein [Dyella japonica]|uniref:Uncharacterized protein n=1 Tax=Dyella japonica DSM 16301 TaxID=1440762 RepID=A0A0G9GZ25_9GAMM|nr:hypothetical protein [Dyella japonica]KLD62506.1 hypothetical protein Y882_15760 [Dyella japonica DSM 16301]
MGENAKIKVSTLQRVTADWLKQLEPNLFVTYTFEEAVSYDRAMKIFGTHVHSLRGELFGRRSKRLIPMVPVIEMYERGSSYGSLLMPSDGTHIHCAYRLPGQPDDYKEVIRRTWTQADNTCGNPDVYCRNSDGWYRELNTDSDAGNVIGYMLKTCAMDTEAVLWKFVSFRQ